MYRKAHVFPAEAAALAVVLLTTDLKCALIAAVGLFVFSILSAGLVGKRCMASNVLRVVFGVIYMAYFCGLVFLAEGYSYQGHFAAVAVALLICLSYFDDEDESECAACGKSEGCELKEKAEEVKKSVIRETAKQSAVASVVILIAGVVRELLGAGSIWGVTVTESTVVSSFYGNTAFGLIIAGLMLAAVAVICKVDLSNRGTVFVLLPAVISLMINARGISGIGKQAFILIVLLAALFSIRKRLKFSETGKPFVGMPIELIMAGILYMVLSWL